MDKRAVWSPKIDCNAKITDSNDCSVAEPSCTKLVADDAQVMQQPENGVAESSGSRGMLEGMIVHYLQSDQPSNLRLKAQTVNCNLLSCKRDLSERIPDSKASIKQAESYKQEFREHQIQQWVSKHSYAQETLPNDHWLGVYPQPGEGIKRAVTPAAIQLVGSYQDLSTGQLIRQPQAFVRNSSSVDHVDSSKKHVHFGSSNALIADSGSLHASEGVFFRKRKFTDLKVGTHQDSPNQAIAADHQLNRAAGSEQPYLEDGSNTTEITLRQWLSRPGRVVDCLESLNIFKQILQFVDLAHTQGVVLKNVRPSLFLLSSLHRVTFLDSASSSSSSGSSEPSTGTASAQASFLADTASKRVESASKGVERHLLMMHTPQSRDVGEHIQPTGRRSTIELTPISPTLTKTSTDRIHFGSDSEAWDSGKAQMQDFPRDPGEGPSNCKTHQKDIFPVRSTRLMEDMWYTSPEEVQDGTCSFASDIYSLGVLFFELFCPFNSWEEHSKIMVDLRHRILPPNLLSDQPKEAAFCLWLLHPEPTSRPKTRDVLQSEILSDAGEALTERQDAMNLEEKEAEAELLLDFLLRMQEQKRNMACKLEDEISCLTSDIMEVKRRRSCSQRSCTILEDPDPSSRITQEGASGRVQWSSKNLTSSGVELHVEETDLFSQGPGNELAVDSTEKEIWGSDTKRKEEQIRSKSARLMSNFDKFEEAYFAMRWNVQPQVLVSQATQEASSHSAPADSRNDLLEVNRTLETATGSTQGKDSLGCFFDSLCKYARYSRFEVKTTLLHGNLLNTSNMVCSLSFDRDQEYFATAGICKRIRVFDCDAVLNENVDIHYPVVEMTAVSKLSSICWNSYIKSHIVSSDYDGVVQLWDASTAQSLMQYKEHKKRTWSVDFSQADPTKLASGSDDGCVKLWSINQEGSIGTIKTEANVCCVQFPSDSAHLIAFGSADYKVYCYDLRSTRLPRCVLMNHTKAVSYVKFLDSDTIVSASTDNTLKLWELSKQNVVGGVCRTPSLTYTGHTNEKNFVGLSVMGGYIACGSETNSVFAYHKSLPMPVATHKFGWLDPLTGKSMGDDTGKFVSSVCWRAKSQTLVAANSLGNVKVLEMV